MMLNEIIEAINGNVKFCLRNSKTFFVSKCSVSGNIIKFTDAVDGIECEEILDNTELMTFASNTIPYMSDLSDIKSFLKINADDHIHNNLIFDDFVRKCVSYMKLFNDQSVNKIKEAVIDNNTGATSLFLESSRRLGDRWTLGLEVRGFVNADPGDALYSFRRDSYGQLLLNYYF